MPTEIHTLNIPKDFDIKDKWWEKYEQLNSALFTYENSGRTGRESIDPYSQFTEGGLKEIRGISNKYTILGYTLNPPFNAKYKSVAIMFENKETFEKVWFHYCQ